jgi:hypothetical protein
MEKMKKLIMLVAAVAMVASFALTASAAEWNFYGSARITTFSNDVEPPVGDNQRDTVWTKQGNGRIGAKVKVSDTLSGRFEYGSGNNINLRLLYATWNFGAGSLTVGQDYTPSGNFYSNQVWGGDEDLIECGQQYVGRRPQLKLAFGDFQIAFISPNTGGIPGGLSLDETTLPRIEAAYGLKMDGFFVDVFGGYQTLKAISNTGNKVDLDSYLIGVGGGADFGPVFVKANVYMARNGASYGLLGYGDSSIGYAGNDIVDNDTLGYLLVAGYKISDTMTVEAGYGAIQHEKDISGADADDASTMYVNCSITLAPGVFVVPEIGIIDQLDDAAGNEQETLTYFGAKWQINF